VEAQHFHFIDTGHCLFFSAVALPFVSPFLLPNMAQPQTDTACHDCIKILQAAATLLSLKSKERPPMILFHNSYQMRLAANLSSSKCHMCTLLGRSIPRLLESPDPKELMGLAISKARHDPDAAIVTLSGYERERKSRKTTYVGSLRIQDSENEAKVIRDRIMKTNSSS
jgi:hypothetical protein